jgi:lipoate-protein ligase A
MVHSAVSCRNQNTIKRSLFSFLTVDTLSTWRLLKLETHNAFMNMAIDEAILTARIEGHVADTLRFYRWEPSAVSVGKFQSVENEVQMENCKQLGVDIVRRITGGGTVYHDAEDEITYSLVASKESLKAEEIADVYERIYTGLTRALNMLGVAADFNEGSSKACPNLTVKGRKISGSAQCHRRGVVLQHGTILTNVNLEKMFTYLRVPWAESCMQVVNVARLKITSLYDELGKSVSRTELIRALREGFGQALDVKIVSGELTPHERELAEKLCERKYVATDWSLHGRTGN